MKLLHVELENIFAYDRPVRVDLDMVTPERNIVLIWGRNGMGKTSFLNSLKLLFLGADREDIRKIGFPPRTLTPRQYVLGDSGSWSGVINRKALNHAKATGQRVTARVKARWQNADESIVTAERQWSTTPAGYEETLAVWDGREKMTGDAAKQRLQDYMPPEFVGFFFFDGEDIKQLAESDDRKIIDFDRLLRITFTEILSDELGELAKERSRGIVAEQLRQQIALSEEALTRARLTGEAEQHRLAELTDLAEEYAADLRRLNARREDLSAGASDAQRAALEERIGDLQTRLADAEYELAESVPAMAPIFANLSLVELARKAVAERLSAVGAAEQVLARRIKHEMPGWIEAAPVALPPDGVVRLSESLGQRIDELVHPASSGGLFGSLDPVRADQIDRRLEYLLLQSADEQNDHVRRLTLVRRLRRELAESREALMRLEVGSQVNLEEYRRTISQIESLEAKRDATREARGQSQRSLENAAEVVRLETQRLRELRTRQEAELKRGKESRFILKLAGTMADIRETLRKSARRNVETRLNARFSDLVYEHGLVERIQIGDAYTMTFLDRYGNPTGRASLSSGLKQLAATAFLWAMKDAVGRERPIVIDTPLGRLDRENQERMLVNYYPRLSSQVIVLPTNTEIDGRKLSLLLPHVAKEYTIHNPFGDGADIRSGSLIEEGGHG